MHYQILGEQVTIHSMNKVKGSVFAISGTGFSKLGLPNILFSDARPFFRWQHREH